jgi:hypothetical protein
LVSSSGKLTAEELQAMVDEGNISCCVWLESICPERHKTIDKT